MYVKKLLYLTSEQKIALDEIKNEIEKNGKKISCMRLLQDSIDIFIEHYSNEAIKKYSSNYPKRID
jgi:NifU-like protein involved in Fe-S cluster formation